MVEVQDNLMTLISVLFSIASFYTVKGNVIRNSNLNCNIKRIQAQMVVVSIE